MTSSQTRHRILEAATKLFNEHGTAAVSTNHIAAAAGISPGNLYYHYRNKEAIIRAILERMFSSWAGTWTNQQDVLPQPGDLIILIQENFELLWQYRFFYRETVALLLRDPELAARHAEMQTQRLVTQEQFYRRYVAAGVFREPDDDLSIPDLVKTTWILATSWLGFLEAGGIQVDEERMREGQRVILRVFKSHLADQSLVELEDFLQDQNS